ncbi:aminotransferase class IV [Anditalea andensis]|uniref:branched-chain-amino-acid transaminase n=1 Tax=Anditalea andensis TaxID=1048983 RepID=A0A074KXJ8_9BACT|nr:aminotransferase class IV [Anditalea andensis]KEO72343.1 hypothetical protein EL17_16485 [Anditalea andensis]
MNGNDTSWLRLSYNGQFITEEADTINRGILFGDGLFETMIYSQGKFRYKEAHLARLQKGCELLYFETEIVNILNHIEKYLTNTYQPMDEIRVRWNVYRAGKGKYTPETNQTSHLLQLQKHHYVPPVTKKAYVNTTLQVPSLPWSNCKTLNALVYVIANHERQKKNFDEVILLNSENNICEAGAANLFWVKNNVFYTPSLRSNCIDGVGRKAIIKALQCNNLSIMTGEFTVAELLSADQVFTSNVTGINYISEIDDIKFHTSSIPFLDNLFK